MAANSDANTMALQAVPTTVVLNIPNIRKAYSGEEPFDNWAQVDPLSEMQTERLPDTQENTQHPSHENADKANDGEESVSWVSQASSSLWSGTQEPFEEFRHKVLALCHHLWPGRKDEVFEIEKMIGGSFSRIVGITVRPPVLEISALARVFGYVQSLLGLKKKPLATPTQRYILRMKRWKDSEGFDEMETLLKIARSITDLPLQRIIIVDKSDDNAIGMPYILEQRLEGENLDGLWEKLNRRQRLSITRQVAQFLLAMQECNNQTHGSFDIDYVRKYGYLPGMLVKTFERSFETPNGEKNHASPLPPILALRGRLVQIDEDWARKVGLFIQVMKIAREIDESTDAFGPDGGYYLHHGDFMPRNIMAEVVDENTARITGILDWELASFVPAILAFAPPSWLWVPGYFYSNKYKQTESVLWETGAKDPENEMDLEIKAMFDEIVGPMYRDYAYHPHAKIVRTMWVNAMGPFNNSTQYHALEGVVQAWKKQTESKAAIEIAVASEEPRKTEEPVHQDGISA